VAHAARGSRKTGLITEMIEDDAIRAHIRRQANWVMVKSFIAGLIFTILALTLP